MVGKISKKKFLMLMLMACAMQENLYAINSKEPEKIDISPAKLEKLEKDKTQGNKYLYLEADKDYDIKMEEDITLSVTESKKGTANIEADSQYSQAMKKIQMKDGTTLTLINTSQNIDSTGKDKIGGAIRAGEYERIVIEGGSTSLIIRDDSMDKENNRFSDGAIQGTNTSSIWLEASKIDISSVGHGINIYHDGKNGQNYATVGANETIIKGGFDSQGKLVNQDANGVLISSSGKSQSYNRINLDGEGAAWGTGEKIHVEGANSAVVVRGGSGVSIGGYSKIKEINLIGHSEKNAAIDLYSDEERYADFMANGSEVNNVNIEAKNHAINAGKNSNVYVRGRININADSTGTNKNNGIQSIAISAGVKSDESNDKNGSTVMIKGADDMSNFINGDIIAGKGGIINFASATNNPELTGSFNIKGNILAANGNTIQNKGETGIINLKLGKDGYLEGRADNYSNGQLKGDESKLIDKVISKGQVNIDLGKNSTWKMTGESWVDNLTGSGTIIVANENKRGQKIHIGNLTDLKTFVLNLAYGNPEKSDMIYVENIKNENTQTLKVANEDELLKNFFSGEKIKFADVLNSNNTQSFGDKYVVKEKGINNIDWDIEYVEISKDKAIDSNRHEVYLVNNAGNTRPNSKPNDVALTLVEMAKANYSSAVFMDNLNKRLGDLTFAEGDSGIWVRTRNDRVGEDSEYRLHNNMIQLGYDKTYSLKNGKEHRGIAFDYTDGQMEYKNLKGESDINRYIVTLYDTKIYDNGLYTDFTARAGYMTSDFEVYGRETGNQVKGDYNNLIFGAGAEFGKKYNFGEKSYFEPQIQLQYTYIDDTDYTTNQDTKVNYDEIHSLIGRAGIRVGHDFYKENSKDNTIYLKFDINHEFLGEQDIKGQDITGTLNKTYNNDNTWYDVGIGGAKNLTEDFYVYADVERQFGNSKDNSWQFNLGFRYKF